MSENSNATVTGTPVLTAKETRKKYGVRKAPLTVPSTAVAYSRPMNFDEQFKGTIVTRSYVIVDPSRGLIIRANTYNGNLGDRVDYLNPANVKPLPAVQANEDGTPTKEMRQALKGYEPVDMGEVPFVTISDDTAEAETPADQQDA